MAVSYSISDTMNYNTVGIGFENPLTVFSAIYGNINFGYTVTFSLDTGFDITEVAVLSNPTYTNVDILSENSVRITRDITQNIFPNEYYSFAEFDPDFTKTITVLPFGDTNQVDLQTDLNRSVFRWDMPSQKVVRGSYTFSISSINTVIIPGTPDAPGVPGTPDVTETISATDTVTYTQDHVWSLIPGTQALLELVNRSKF